MPGLDIDFCVGGNREAYLGRGWGIAEPHGSWTVAEHATLILPGEAAPPGCLVALLLRPHVLLPVCATQDLSIYVNEIHILTRRLTAPERIRFRLPEGAAAPGAPVTLRLRCPGAISPRALGAGLDPRALGISLVRLTIEAADRPS